MREDLSKVNFDAFEMPRGVDLTARRGLHSSRVRSGKQIVIEPGRAELGDRRVTIDALLWQRLALLVGEDGQAGLAINKARELVLALEAANQIIGLAKLDRGLCARKQ